MNAVPGDTSNTPPVAIDPPVETAPEETVVEETAPEEANPLAELPAPPEESTAGALPAKSPAAQPPTVSPERFSPREPYAPAVKVPAATLPSNPADWEILAEPAKLPGTSLPPVFAPQSPFSNEPLSAVARQKKLALPLKDARVVILKSQRRLDLYSGNTLVKSYRVSLGSNPNGHKQRQGDGRTPEGRYFICTRNSTNSAFHVFLGLSYPAAPDAKRAVNNKQISWREYQLINQRLASRSAPLWETRLGGWVGIHGGTDAGFAQKKMRARGSRDWTAGCIALTDRQIEEIHAATKLGTPVDIRP